MPNHMHGIACLQGEKATFKTLLGRIINAYKGAVTTRIRVIAVNLPADAPLRVPTEKIWQAYLNGESWLWQENDFKYISG